jgi:polynucleotide 5'-hydroxyl-kinase GRC3/NOL9
MTCPDEYLAAIHQLVEHYRYEIQYPTSEASSSRSIPLVVNTQGWVKGLGEDLLRSIELMVQPTHIFGFDNPTYDLPEGGGGWTNSPPPVASDLPGVYDTRSSSQQVFTLEPAPISPLQARHTPADLRILSTISYFHANLCNTLRETWNFASPLIAIPPWEVDLGGTSIEQVYLIGEGSDGIIREDLPLALNGSIVALLEVLDNSPLIGDVYQQNRPLPPLEETNFLGLAVIRSVLPAEGSTMKIRLITPLPPAMLGRAKIIVRNGAIELPLCGMLDWQSGPINEEGLAGIGWSEVPFLDVNGEIGVGGERRRYRRNVMRKGM